MISALRRSWTGLSDAQRYFGVAAVLTIGVSFVLKVFKDGMDPADWLLGTLLGFLTILVLGLLFMLVSRRSRRVSRFIARATLPIVGAGVGLGLVINRLSDFAAASVLAGISGILLAVTLSFSKTTDRPGTDVSDVP